MKLKISAVIRLFIVVPMILAGCTAVGKYTRENTVYPDGTTQSKELVEFHGTATR